MGIAAIVILFIAFKVLGPVINPSAEILSKSEAKTLVEERYNGQVTEIILKNNQFDIEMDRNEMNYEIKLDAENGEVISFTKKSNISSNNTDSEQVEPNPPAKPITENEATVIITEDEAIQIALKEVKGEINDVDLESDDNIHYYLVEIDTTDDREATVQINAITGEVLSITWDD